MSKIVWPLPDHEQDYDDYEDDDVYVDGREDNESPPMDILLISGTVIVSIILGLQYAVLRWSPVKVVKPKKALNWVCISGLSALFLAALTLQLLIIAHNRKHQRPPVNPID